MTAPPPKPNPQEHLVHAEREIVAADSHAKAAEKGEVLLGTMEQALHLMQEHRGSSAKRSLGPRKGHPPS